jgi:acyl-coenzyme A synthetase/AMP-(fatty) acid ligase
LLLGDVGQVINLVATVPAQHMWGMETTVLLPLFAKVSVLHLSPFFPQDIANALQKLPAPRALVSSPVHLEALLRSGVELPSLERIFTATAPLSETLARNHESALDTMVVDILGSSETGIIARSHTYCETLWTLSEEIVLVTTSSGDELHAAHLPETVLIPDIIEVAGPRRFRWLGRLQDMVNIAGKRGSLNDLNQRLLRVQGVEDGVIFMPAGDGRRLRHWLSLQVSKSPISSMA